MEQQDTERIGCNGFVRDGTTFRAEPMRHRTTKKYSQSIHASMEMSSCGMCNNERLESLGE